MLRPLASEQEGRVRRAGVASARRRAAQLRLSAAQREALGRELHDQVMQPLVLLVLHMARLKQTGTEAQLDESLDELSELAGEALASLRQLTRGLHRQPQLEGGLVNALNLYLLPRWRRLTGLAIELQVDDDWPRVMNSDAELQVFRLIQESLANVYRHSTAVHVEVRLEARDSSAVLTVVDDGEPVVAAFHSPEGQGIESMRQRVSLLGGRLSIGYRPGGGAEVRAEFAVASLQ